MAFPSGKHCLYLDLNSLVVVCEFHEFRRGLNPKGLAVRLAWMEADKAKKEAENVKKVA
jgi:hypothetical protein